MFGLVRSAAISCQTAEVRPEANQCTRLCQVEPKGDARWLSQRESVASVSRVRIGLGRTGWDGWDRAGAGMAQLGVHIDAEWHGG